MMQRDSTLLKYLLLLLCLLFSNVKGACKSGEGDPYGPHVSPTKRIYSYNPFDPSLDTSTKTGSVLDILSFNIQSGLSMTCGYNLDAQSNHMKSAHFFGLQEVDEFNDLRCMCSQPSNIAKNTGHTVLFLNTIFYRTGRYGSALGSAFPILETRFKMFQNTFGEERGITAIRTQPHQLKGKDLWYLNTHFQFDGEYWRTLQAEETVAFAKSLLADFPSALLILTGDFYITPGLVSYSTMETYFENAWTVFNGNANNGFTYPSNWPSNRFDHIWFKFPEGTQYSLDVEMTKTQESDHLPLWAHFDFEHTTQQPAGCLVDIKAVLRPESVTNVNNGMEGTYDLIATNNGDKIALRVNFDINLPTDTSAITSWWWFARTAPTYMDLPAMSPGSTYLRGGFTLRVPGQTTLLPPSIIYKSTVCQ